MGLKEMLEQIKSGEVELPPEPEFDKFKKWAPTQVGDVISGLILSFEEHKETKPEYGVSTIIEVDTGVVNGFTGERGRVRMNGQAQESAVYSVFVRPYKATYMLKDLELLIKGGKRFKWEELHHTNRALIKAISAAREEYEGQIEFIEAGQWFTAEFRKRGDGDPPKDGEPDMRAKFYDYKLEPYADEKQPAAATAAAEPAGDKAKARRAALVSQASGAADEPF